MAGSATGTSTTPDRCCASTRAVGAPVTSGGTVIVTVAIIGWVFGNIRLVVHIHYVDIAVSMTVNNGWGAGCRGSWCMAIGTGKGTMFGMTAGSRAGCADGDAVAGRAAISCRPPGRSGS